MASAQWVVEERECPRSSRAARNEGFPLAGEMDDDGGNRGATMMRMSVKMKTLFVSLLLPLLSAGGLLAEEKPEAKAKGKGERPTVEVYLVRKMEVMTPEAIAKPGAITMSGVIMEIANPTEQTFYVHGVNIERPAFDLEVKRGEKWWAKPAYMCGVGMETFPLKPGAKMLVTVDAPEDEPVSRFRFYFFTTDDEKTTRVVTVRSRVIEAKELTDMESVGKVAPELGEEYYEPETDEEMNRIGEDQQKHPEKYEGAPDPFDEKKEKAEEAKPAGE